MGARGCPCPPVLFIRRTPVLTDSDYKITTVAPTATGTSTITSSAIDMTGFDGAVIIVRSDRQPPTTTSSIQQCATSGGSYADLTGTRAGITRRTTRSSWRSTDRWRFLKYVVTRGTTTTIDSVTIIQYGAKGVLPVTQPSGTQIGLALPSRRRHGVSWSFGFFRPRV
jgi:hypothetical protein